MVVEHGVAESEHQYLCHASDILHYVHYGFVVPLDARSLVGELEDYLSVEFSLWLTSLSVVQVLNRIARRSLNRIEKLCTELKALGS